MDVSQPEPKDTALIRLLVERDGSETRVALGDGSILSVLNIAWGYDLGDEFAHVTTNVSPFVEGANVDFFFTSDVVSVSDPINGDALS